jgi:glycosyltransferase involved in cell wall biosynthesis
VPRLKGRVVTIYNCVNLDFFRPAVDRPPARRDHLSLVVAATYMAKKNLHGLVAAIATLGKRRPDLKVEVDWYGAIPPKDRTVFDTGLHQVREAGMQDRIRLHAATSEIVDAYLQADAVILPSFYEGLPNMICEAMACGRPILMSAVCDAGNLVKDGENGFLFDPSSSEDIAGAIERFSELDENVRARLGRRSREMAEALFDVDRFTAKYLEVLKAATRRTLVPIEHQPPEVPATAVSFAGRKSQ